MKFSGGWGKEEVENWGFLSFLGFLCYELDHRIMKIMALHMLNRVR